MAKYRAGVPSDANKFSYNGKEYEGGDILETDDACEILGFYNAFKEVNPESNATDRSTNFWKEREAECPSGGGITPGETTTTEPIEADPQTMGPDSAVYHGAPEPVGPTMTGEVQQSVPPENPHQTEEPTRPPDGEPFFIFSFETPQIQTDAGDPVDIFSGSFYLNETDLEIPNTILPLAFTRIYRSGNAAFGPFGWNWDHNYNAYLRELNDGNIAVWRNLHEDIFRFDGLNFEPPPGTFEKLARVPALAQTYEIWGEGGTTMRFERPAGWIDGERIPLIWLSDRHGNTLHFTYGAEDKLAEVRDDDNRFFQFTYDACGLLVAAEDQAGRKYIYEHDEQTMQLVKVTSPATTDHPDGIVRIYHYEHPSALPQLRHNILRVEDAEGNVYLQNTYEQDPASLSFARVTSQLYGNYLYQFAYTPLQYVPQNVLYMNIPSLRVEVMNPDFGLETYTFNYRGDLLDKRFRLNKDKSFRVVATMYEFDIQGNLTKHTRPDGSEEINIYDATNPDPRMRGKLLRKELTSAAGFPSPSRIIWRGEYEPVYQLLVEERNEINAITAYEYDFDITPAAPNNTGKLLRLVYPEATRPDGTIQTAVTSFEVNNKGQIEAIILPDGVRNELMYGNAGNAINRIVEKRFDVAGLNVLNTIAYDAFGYETLTTDGNGNTTEQIRNVLGLVEKMILPAINGNAAENRMHYDSDKRVISVERPKGEFTDAVIAGNYIIDNIERDVLGYPVRYFLSSNTGEERTINVCRDFRGFAARTVYPDGSKLKSTYDERGLLISEEILGTDGTKLSSKKAYARNGNLIQETDSSQMTTKYEYDGFNRLSKKMLPNGSEIIYKWLPGDVMESEETYGDDGFGNFRLLSKTVYTYDEKYRKVSETIQTFTDNPALAVDITRTFFFTPTDRIERIVDNRGGIRIYQFDGMGRVSVEIDPMGNEEHSIYDGTGNLVQKDSHHIEPDGTVSVLTKRFSYDERGRKIAAIEPDGASVICEYDDRNLLVRETDLLGQVNETTYNSFGDRLTEVVDVNGLAITKSWTVNNMSRVTSFTDPVGEISRYFFDGVGRINKTEYPNGFESTRVLNPGGLITKETMGSGTVFDYQYDAANRVIQIINTASPVPIVQVPTHQFRYDGLDRVVWAKVGLNEITRKYDSKGRLVSEESHGNIISCTYDDNAGTVDKLWPDGRTERLLHDLNGNITTIEETAAGGLGSGGNLIATFTPSGGSFIGEAIFQGNLTLVNKYDDRKRLVNLAMSSPAGTNEEVKYRYDIANRRRVEVMSGINPVLKYFEFDNHYRLTRTRGNFAVAIPNALTQAEHDAVINAVELASAGAAHAEEFTYNQADDRLSYAETGSPVRNYTYLPGHRIQNDGINNYTYTIDGTVSNDGSLNYRVDALGRVVSVFSGINLVCSIEYDAFGRPGVINEQGRPARSLNYLGAFVEQINENGVAVRQSTLHPLTGVPIAHHLGSGTFYTLFDARYNLLALADVNGNVVETYRYKSFGEPSVFDAASVLIPSSAFDIEPIFGGQTYLSSVGLYLSKRRLMNPVNGHFLSSDPAGYEDSPSLYVYGAQNPIDNIDPTGEAIPLIVVVLVIGGAAAGGGYSVYDSYHHPEKYEGSAGVWRPMAQTFAGAAIGGASALGGEVVLAYGGIGSFATGGTAVTLTTGQTFVLYGTATAYSGAIGRAGFNQMFPEYIDPVSPGTVATDFVVGGGLPIAAPVIKNGISPLLDPVSQMYARAMGGNWRLFGNTWRLVRNPRTQYGWKNIFWNNKTFKSTSEQYWNVSRGANGNALHHIWFQNQSTWVPQGLRNAGFNLLEIPGPLNTWMGGRLPRELAFRGIIASILGTTGYGSYKGTDWLLNGDDEAGEVKIRIDFDEPDDASWGNPSFGGGLKK